MKKLLSMLIITAAAQTFALETIVKGTDNLGTWADKTNLGLEAAEPAGFAMYATSSVPVSATTNAVIMTDWTGATLETNVLVVASNGTAQVLTDGVYDLNMSGTFNGGTNEYTYGVCVDDVAVSQMTETATGTNDFSFRYPVSLATSSTLTFQITVDVTNLTPTVTTPLFWGLR